MCSLNQDPKPLVYAGMRVCGYAGMRVCGYAGMRVCGSNTGPPCFRSPEMKGHDKCKEWDRSVEQIAHPQHRPGRKKRYTSRTRVQAPLRVIIQHINHDTIQKWTFCRWRR